MKEEEKEVTRILIEIISYITSTDGNLIEIERKEMETNSCSIHEILRFDNEKVKVEVNAKEIRVYDNDMHGGSGMQLVRKEEIFNK